MRSGWRVTTSWQIAPPVSLPTSVTSSSPSDAAKSATSFASPGGERSAPGVHRRHVRAQRQVGHHAAVGALEPRHDLAPQGPVDERAVDEDDRRGVGGAGLRVGDRALVERDGAPHRPNLARRKAGQASGLSAIGPSSSSGSRLAIRSTATPSRSVILSVVRRVTGRPPASLARISSSTKTIVVVAGVGRRPGADRAADLVQEREQRPRELLAEGALADPFGHLRLDEPHLVAEQRVEVVAEAVGVGRRPPALGEAVDPLGGRAGRGGVRGRRAHARPSWSRAACQSM